LECDIASIQQYCKCILLRIGEGKFGLVMKCQNLKNNKTVAVKIIKEANGQCLF
uniref:Protein kinase domain-containing protein n=1 Tax=Gouania willdenowi TaxID=441366 RepID=A0A8C5DWA9_GOUWI